MHLPNCHSPPFHHPDPLFHSHLWIGSSRIPVDLSSCPETQKRGVNKMNSSPHHCSWSWDHKRYSSSPLSLSILNVLALSYHLYWSRDLPGGGTQPSFLRDLTTGDHAFLQRWLLHLSIHILSWARGYHKAPRWNARVPYILLLASIL